jgi:bifunctional non-homologous end joining protein LigD
VLEKARLPMSIQVTKGSCSMREFGQGEIGPELFRKACEFGLEGLVSKRRDRPYRGGGQKHWIKVKNRKHPAMERVATRFANENACVRRGELTKTS